MSCFLPYPGIFGITIFSAYDPQGSLTASLGYQRPDQMENTLAEILGRIISDEPQNPGEGIIQQAEGVDLLPANIELPCLEVTLVNTMSRETILREYLNGIRDRYDVILLDCCPSLGMLTINALAAADKVIIPSQAHYLSLRGMEQLIRMVNADNIGGRKSLMSKRSRNRHTTKLLYKGRDFSWRPQSTVS